MSTERVRAPRDRYVNVKRVQNPHDHEKTWNEKQAVFQVYNPEELSMIVSEERQEPIFNTVPQETGPLVRNHWHWVEIFEEVTDVSWQEINRAATASIERVGMSLDVWKLRCSGPDKDWGSPDVCWIYLIRAHVGWYWLQSWGRYLRWWERIVGPGPMSVERYFVRICIGLVFLGQDQFQLVTYVPPIGVPWQHDSWNVMSM